MEDMEFKGYVVDALKQIIERQDNTERLMDTRIDRLDNKKLKPWAIVKTIWGVANINVLTL